MSVAKRMMFEQMERRCAYEYELEDCDFQDSWPRPGDPCSSDDDEGCEFCEEHCPKQRCRVHRKAG